MHTVEELVEALRRPGAQTLTRQVVEAMTTNETSFFRDLHPFDALKATILPELLNNRFARTNALDLVQRLFQRPRGFTPSR